MPSVEFEPAIPTIKQPQTYILDCPATGIGPTTFWHSINSRFSTSCIEVYITNIPIQVLNAGEVNRNCTGYVNGNPKSKY